MSTLREAAEKALMALTFAEESGRHWPMAVKMARNAAIEALRAALSAAPAPQPAGGERERYEFVLAQCREAQDIAASRGWALNDIATASTTDPRARKIATEALLSALSQPAAQQEPVAHMWQHPETGMTGFVEHASPDDLAQWERMNRPRKIVTPLYTQAEERKPLTDEQIDRVLDALPDGCCDEITGAEARSFARAIEAELRKLWGISPAGADTKGDRHD